MKKANSDYSNLGFSSTMGPQLRKLVEQHLINDLKHYGVDEPVLKFDWSDSCIEGHDADFLDGSLENYSGIAVYDANDIIVADGWMEFILTGDFFLVYWDDLTTWQEDQQVSSKEEFGIPDHIWQQLPDDIKPTVKDELMKTSPFK